MKLYINLLNFCDEKLAGVGYYFKRIISSLDFDDPDWELFEEIILLTSDKVDAFSLFDIKQSKKITIKRVKLMNNVFFRILYEQIYLPLNLLFCKGVFFSPTPAIPLLLNKVNKKMRVIPTIHDMIPFKVSNKYTFFRSIYVKSISLLAAKLGSNIITVSDFSRRDIAHISKVNPNKISVVYNFVTEFNHETKFSDNSYFLTLSTIEPGKNIENMLRGFADFLIKYPMYSQMRYKFAGKLGWNYDRILQLVGELNLNDKVDFLGYVNDDEKAQLLSECTAIVYLSLYEGFGIPPLEGMYFNKVSIVSDNSSLPEVVGEAGIIQNVMDYRLLSENMNKVIQEKDSYTKYIPAQIKKFNSLQEIQKFKSVLKFTK